MNLLALLLASVLDATPGMLCSPGQCVAAERVGDRIEFDREAISPDVLKESRIWISSDGQQVVLLGSPPIEGEPIEVPRPTLTIDLTTDLETDKLDFSLERDGEKWSATTVPPASNRVRVAAPAGDYALTISSKAHRPSQHKVALRDDLRIRAHLVAAPAITGTVQEAVGNSPIRGAEIRDEHGGVVAMTDDRGRFRIALERSRPAGLTIAAPGYGRRTLLLTSDDDLGVVFLYRGATLSLDLVHPYRESEPFAVDVSVYSRSAAGHHSLEKKVTATTGAVELVDLAPGAYLVHAKGPEPLQQSTKEITLREGVDEHLYWFLAPRTAHVSVTRDGEAIPEAKVEIKASQIWRASIPMDQAGQYSGELWDAEDVAIVVSGGSLRTPYLSMHRIGDANPAFILVDVPAGVISGVVLDAESRVPLTAATIKVESLSGEVRFNQATRTDEEGRFEVSAAMAGTHKIAVEAPGYLPERLELTTEKNEKKKLDVALVRGRIVRVTVSDARGALVPNGLVALGITRDGVQAEKTAFAGPDGTAELTIDETTRRDALLIDPAGAFFWTSIGPDTPDEVHVRLPPATSALLVKAHSAEGPRGNIGVVVRYNGRLIPYGIWTSLLGWRSRGARTDASGQLDVPHLPPGRYDLFVFESSEELLGLLASHQFRTPALALDLDPGASATVTVALESP